MVLLQEELINYPIVFLTLIKVVLHRVLKAALFVHTPVVITTPLKVVILESVSQPLTIISPVSQ